MEAARALLCASGNVEAVSRTDFNPIMAASKSKASSEASRFCNSPFGIKWLTSGKFGI